MDMVGTSVVTPVLYITFIFLFVFGFPIESGKSFDQEKWLTDKEKRYEMARDIIKSNVIITRDTNQVKQILGQPTSGNNSNWHPDSLNIWTYEMGEGGGRLGFLFHNLVIRFEKGQVVAVEHAKYRD
jgi:hypothetical protein